ncbi:probable G-protein coupled receptor 150 [Hemiscyllium ocellatum]|uniref:probable G-protein coupled receptor 150 n=1 Tax=Hemiscyllium ocellatum TaxID=170820 RepID=UPI0029676D6D|nr:probable G-protein coupled receptor 150 [Hemiscyllium ocellatum]
MALDSPFERNFSLDAWSVNPTGNVSDVFELPLYHRQMRIISMTVIFSLALIGNVAVLHRNCCSQSRRRKIDALVSNLAAADLCVSVLLLLSQIIQEALEGEWLAGDVACKMFKVFQAFGLIASSGIIVIVALERHHVIVNPLASPLPTRILTAVIWIGAFVLSLPQAFVFKLTVQEGREKCLSVFGQLPKWHFQVYIMFGAVIVFLAPFCTLCVAYTRILWIIWRQKQHIRKGKASEKVNQKQQRKVQIHGTNGSIPRAKVKTLKMTLVMIIFFVVCRLLYFIIEMKVAFGTITETDTKVITALGIFVVSNSAGNPYVYLFFKTNNVHFRRLEKSVCFTCLKDYRENTFHRELCAIGKRVEHSRTTLKRPPSTQFPLSDSCCEFSTGNSHPEGVLSEERIPQPGLLSTAGSDHCYSVS